MISTKKSITILPRSVKGITLSKNEKIRVITAGKSHDSNVNITPIDRSDTDTVVKVENNNDSPVVVEIYSD